MRRRRTGTFLVMVDVQLKMCSDVGSFIKMVIMKSALMSFLSQPMLIYTQTTALTPFEQLMGSQTTS